MKSIKCPKCREVYTEGNPHTCPTQVRLSPRHFPSYESDAEIKRRIIPSRKNK